MTERSRTQIPVVRDKNVPMRTRDGATLRPDIVRRVEALPVLVSRTPYGKDTATQNQEGSLYCFARRGYATVMQDCRGPF